MSQHRGLWVQVEAGTVAGKAMPGPGGKDVDAAQSMRMMTALVPGITQLFLIVLLLGPQRLLTDLRSGHADML